MFPRAVSRQRHGRFGLGFMGIFLAGGWCRIIYEWKKGALEWGT